MTSRWYVHTLRPEDVGKCTIRIHTRRMPLCLSSLLGRVQRHDVGKRIWGSHDRGGREVLYLETDLRRDARQRKDYTP